MNRRLFIAGAAAAAATLAAGEANAQTPPAPAPAVTPEFTMKIVTPAPDPSPWVDGIKLFQKDAKTKSNGRFIIKSFLGPKMDEFEMVQAVVKGQYQAAGVSTGAVASVVPELAALELPRLFRSEKEADHILDNVILAAAEKALAARGLVLGFWSENGFRGFGTNFGLIKSPADLKGRKMRSQENPAHLEMYRALGASPVPISVDQVLTSLQTGVVDGYDNTVIYAFAAKWTTATKFFSTTNLIYQPAAIIYNKAWYDGLPADIKAIVNGARANVMPKIRNDLRSMKPILIENLKALKLQVYEPTEAEVAAAFDAAAKTAHTNYLAKAGAAEKAMYTAITNGLKAHRGK